MTLMARTRNENIKEQMRVENSLNELIGSKQLLQYEHMKCMDDRFSYKLWTWKPAHRWESGSRQGNSRNRRIYATKAIGRSHIYGQKRVEIVMRQTAKAGRTRLKKRGTIFPKQVVATRIKRLSKLNNSQIYNLLTGTFYLIFQPYIY